MNSKYRVVTISKARGSKKKTVRGGSVYSYQWYVRSAYRYRFYPNNRSCGYIGLRVVVNGVPKVIKENND